MAKSGRGWPSPKDYRNLTLDEYDLLVEYLFELRSLQSAGQLKVSANKSFEEGELSTLRELPEDMLTFICCESDGEINFVYYVTHSNFGKPTTTHFFKFRNLAFVTKDLDNLLSEFIGWISQLNYGPAFGTERYNGQMFLANDSIDIEEARKMLEKIWRMN